MKFLGYSAIKMTENSKNRVLAHLDGSSTGVCIGSDIRGSDPPDRSGSDRIVVQNHGFIRRILSDPIIVKNLRNNSQKQKMPLIFENYVTKIHK